MEFGRADTAMEASCNQVNDPPLTRILRTFILIISIFGAVNQSIEKNSYYRG